MKLVLSETKLIKEPVTIINDLVNEARFKVKKDSMELIAMDPANVAMVVFRLLSSSFIEYTVKEETVLGLNLNDFKQVLRRIKANDNLVLEVSENKLKLTLQGNSVRTFFLPLIDLDEREQKIPELKFKAQVKCPSTMLNDAIEDVEIISESVSFQSDDKKFVISASGDSKKANIEIKSDENVAIKSEEKVKSKYSIEYLKKMIQASKISNNVEISFSKDYPLKLEYKEIDKIQMIFILAPRIEEND